MADVSRDELRAAGSLRGFGKNRREPGRFRGEAPQSEFVASAGYRSFQEALCQWISRQRQMKIIW